MNEKGDVRLQLTYLLKRFPRDPQAVRLVVTTSAEFLRISDSEVQIQ